MIKTADILITINKKEIVLIKRVKEPFLDKFVLPGGHVEKFDESLAHTCVREAFEEILFEAQPEELTKLTTTEQTNDPRPGRRFSTTFHIDLPNKERLKNCKTTSEVKSIHILPIKSISKDMIGFNHYEAIKIVKKHSH